MAERTLGGKTIPQLIEDATQLAYSRFVSTATPTNQFERDLLQTGAAGGAAAMLSIVFDIIEAQIQQTERHTEDPS